MSSEMKNESANCGRNFRTQIAKCGGSLSSSLLSTLGLLSRHSGKYGLDETQKYEGPRFIQNAHVQSFAALRVLRIHSASGQRRKQKIPQRPFLLALSSRKKRLKKVETQKMKKRGEEL
jgi:hypothetical protein